MTLEELKVVITAETSGLQALLDQVLNQVSSFSKNTTKSTNAMGTAFSKLGKFISVAAISAGLIKIGKSAINAASDLAEVQNVVDVAFGAAAQEVNDFASTTITQLGMSELSAKQFSSTFMAMGNGMGVAADAGKNMAIELTKLTGDMASFYNVEQDVAATALKSVYTGETETLKKFGVVMTEANLEAYALSQGITKQYREMSQAEKVALRYGFVMQSTANAQGDFARTSDSWANQTRILKEQFNQLLSVIGNGLVQALTPAIKAMNLLLASAISVANAMAKSFGWTGIESTSTEVQSTASGMEETVAATEEENKEAKKLKNTLGSFDELNVLNSKDDASGSSGSGLGDLGASTTAEAKKDAENLAEAQASGLKKFVDEAKLIFDKWFDDLPKLEINFDAEKAKENLKNIGLNLANIFAGWSSFIITIGINVLNDINIGQIANDMLEFWEATTGLASALTDVLVPALEEFYNIALKPIVEWIGDTLHDVIQTAKDIINDMAEFVKEHSKGIQAAIKIIGEAIKIVWAILEPVATFIVQVLLLHLKNLWQVLKFILGIALDLCEVLVLAFTDPAAAVDLLKQKVAKWVEDFYEMISNIVNNFKTLFEKVFGNLTESWGGLFDHLYEGAKNFVLFIGLLFEGIPELLSIAWNKIKTGATQAVVAVKTVFGTIPEWFRTTFTTAWENVKKVFSSGGKVFDGIKDGILNGLKTVVNALIKGINKVIKVPFDGLNKALSKIKNISIFGTTPFKNLISDIKVPQIPTLAKGGILDKPTLAMLGEYNGANNNPEIAAPQSLIEEIIDNKNSVIIDTFAQMTRQLISAISDVSMNVSIGDDVIAQAAARGNKSYLLRTGKALIV